MSWRSTTTAGILGLIAAVAVAVCFVAWVAPAEAGGAFVICATRAQQSQPAVDGKRIVWVDWRPASRRSMGAGAASRSRRSAGLSAALILVSPAP